MAAVSAGAVLKGEKELVKMLRDLGGRGETELKREVKRTSISIENHYKRDVKDNGNLENTISYTLSPSGLNSEIGSNAEHAIFIEFGTKAHGPVSKKFLHFIAKDGTEVFTKWVKGIRSNPALTKAWIAVMIGNRFADRLRKRFDRIK